MTNTEDLEELISELEYDLEDPGHWENVDLDATREDLEEARRALAEIRGGGFVNG